MRIFKLLVFILYPFFLFIYLDNCHGQTIKVEITSYNNHEDQTDDTPNRTAFNREYGKNKHACMVHHCGIAVSRNLEDQGFKHNCRVHLDFVYNPLVRLDNTDYCNGLYVINDRTHFRWMDLVDVFLFDKEKSVRFGRQTGTITLLWCE